MIFNFEEWAQLARQDQAAFEQKRTATIRQAIDNTAHNDRERRMLNGLQFRVDMVRRKHKSPLGACIVLSQMLSQQLDQLLHLDIDGLTDSDSQANHQPTEQGKVIPFHNPKK